MFGSNKQTLDTAIRDAAKAAAETVIEQARRDLDGFREIPRLQGVVTKLKEEVEALTIQKGRKEEEYARKEREIEHKVGLERKRQEFEVEQAKRETMVKVREENLTADKARFEQEMKFTRDRFTEEVGYLKEMVGKVLERLPTAEIIANVSKGESASKGD